MEVFWGMDRIMSLTLDDLLHQISLALIVITGYNIGIGEPSKAAIDLIGFIFVSLIRLTIWSRKR